MPYILGNGLIWEIHMKDGDVKSKLKVPHDWRKYPVTYKYSFHWLAKIDPLPPHTLLSLVFIFKETNSHQQIFYSLDPNKSMYKRQKHVGYFLHLYTYNLNILHICFFFLFSFVIWLPTVIILLRQNLSFSKVVFNLQQIEI